MDLQEKISFFNREALRVRKAVLREIETFDEAYQYLTGLSIGLLLEPEKIVYDGKSVLIQRNEEITRTLNHFSSYFLGIKKQKEEAEDYFKGIEEWQK